ncbi:MAG TPA: Uma2 family endonuclease [Gemmatimonadaceae bacterium]
MALTVPRYTVADLDLLPDDGNRYEVLAGTLLVTPSPGSAHQGVAASLAALFASHLLARRLRLFSPGVVTLPPLTQLEPDLLVVPPRFALGMPWAEITEHWLAVEILSRSSRVYDREFKRDAYLALGVREVWLVDPRDRSIEVCTQPGEGRVVRDAVTWSMPDGDVSVHVELAELFTGII